MKDSIYIYMTIKQTVVCHRFCRQPFNLLEDRCLTFCLRVQKYIKFLISTQTNKECHAENCSILHIFNCLPPKCCLKTCG